MNLLWWLQLLFSMHGGARDPESPFFVAPAQRTKPYLYRDALKDSRKLYARVLTKEEAEALGLHGQRVEGWNRVSKYDKQLAVAQGGWEPTGEAFERYESGSR